MHDLKKLAAYFKRIQEENGYTQQAMAKAAGVAQSTINKILNEHHIRATTVERIAKNLRVNIHELYRYTGAIPPIEKKNPDGTFTREYLLDTICHELADLSPEHQREVIRLIREFAVRKR